MFRSWARSRIPEAYGSATWSAACTGRQHSSDQARAARKRQRVAARVQVRRHASRDTHARAARGAGAALLLPLPDSSRVQRARYALPCVGSRALERRCKKPYHAQRAATADEAAVGARTGRQPDPKLPRLQAPVPARMRGPRPRPDTTAARRIPCCSAGFAATRACQRSARLAASRRGVASCPKPSPGCHVMPHLDAYVASTGARRRDPWRARRFRKAEGHLG